MEIERIIGELLLRHACVVVPGFGGFICSQTSASIDFERGIITPPRKAVLFNKQLVNNDGLLLSALAASMNCTYDEAALNLKNLLELWQDDLQNGKRINIEKVGYLYLDVENNLLFEQDRFFNLLLQSYGLGQVKFISEKQVVAEIKETPLVQEAKIIPLVQTQEVLTQTSSVDEKTAEPQIIVQLPRRKIMRYVAAACVLPLAFYSFWLPSKTDVLESGLLSFHDLNPFHKQSKSVYQSEKLQTRFDVLEETQSLDELTKNVPQETEIYPLEFENSADDTELFYVRLQKQNSLQKVVSEEKEAVQAPKTIQLIAGSFSNENNARALVSSLNKLGFNEAEIRENGGMFRVIAAGASSLNEAENLKGKLLENGISTWILK